ncbi:unnamed protein product [Polarella glacialis]|uniref:Uncharacterized protein n=1 Tax=Polarella glacialis TaxID=89957 RepID=A0A813JHM4_POLGL|nr:unnamed protein product [Polarella glacialis]CAE8679000.1 unnamed protein product [Polarella glacialis]
MESLPANASWDLFFSNVDSVPVSQAVKTSAEVLFMDKLGFASPQEAEGMVEGDILPEQLPASLPAKAFCRRVIRSLEVLHHAKRFKTGALMSVGSPSASLNAHTFSMNAATAAAAMASPSKANDVDVQALLEKKDMKTMSFHLMPEQCVWNELMAEVELAATQGRVAFSYIDLTSKDILPVWIPVDAVGGRFSLDEVRRQQPGRRAVDLDTQPVVQGPENGNRCSTVFP